MAVSVGPQGPQWDGSVHTQQSIGPKGSQWDGSVHAWGSVGLGDPMDGSVHQPPTPRKLWVDPNPSHSPKGWGLSPSPAPQRVPVAPFRGTAALGSPGRTPPWGHCRPRVPPGRGSGDTQGGDRIPWVAPGQGWHPIIPSPCPQPRCPPPHPTPHPPSAILTLPPTRGAPRHPGTRSAVGRGCVGHSPHPKSPGSCCWAAPGW